MIRANNEVKHFPHYLFLQLHLDLLCFGQNLVYLTWLVSIIKFSLIIEWTCIFDLLTKLILFPIFICLAWLVIFFSFYLIVLFAFSNTLSKDNENYHYFVILNYKLIIYIHFKIKNQICGVTTLKIIIHKFSFNVKSLQDRNH